MPDREREKEYKEYKFYNVSNEQEREWTREYVSYWISKLSVDDFQAVNNLSAVCVKEALPEIFRISELGDSFVKLWYANAIWKIASGSMMSPIMRERARRKSIHLWRSLLNNPIELTDDHRKEILGIIARNRQFEKSIQSRGRQLPQFPPRPMDYPAATPDDYILNYAKSDLKESKKENALYFLFVSLFIGVFGMIQMFIDFIDKIRRSQQV